MKVGKSEPAKSSQEQFPTRGSLEVMSAYGQIIGTLAAIFGTFLLGFGLAIIALFELVLRAQPSSNDTDRSAYHFADNVVLNIGRTAWYTWDGRPVLWYDLVEGIVIALGLLLIVILGACLGTLWYAILGREDRAKATVRLAVLLSFPLLAVFLILPAVLVGTAASAETTNPSVFLLISIATWLIAFVFAWPFRRGFLASLGRRGLMVSLLAAGGLAWTALILTNAISPTSLFAVSAIVGLLGLFAFAVVPVGSRLWLRLRELVAYQDCCKSGGVAPGVNSSYATLLVV